MITQKELKKLVRYDRSSGHLIWRASPSPKSVVRCGDVVGAVGIGGYASLNKLGV